MYPDRKNGEGKRDHHGKKRQSKKDPFTLMGTTRTSKEKGKRKEGGSSVKP